MRDMIQVVNGAIIREYIPKNATMLDGTSVSNYDLLPDEDLKLEGWLPVSENIPEYNDSTQYLQFKEYIIREDEVIRTYTIVDIVIEPEEPTELDILKAKINAMVEREEFLEDLIAEMAMMVYD